MAITEVNIKNMKKSIIPHKKMELMHRIRR